MCAMANVWQGAEALDVWGRATYDADVVEHGGFVDKGLVGLEFGVSLRNFNGQIGHACAMRHEQMAEMGVWDIELIYDGQNVYHSDS